MFMILSPLVSCFVLLYVQWSIEDKTKKINKMKEIRALQCINTVRFALHRHSKQNVEQKFSFDLFFAVRCFCFSICAV